MTENWVMLVQLARASGSIRMERIEIVSSLDSPFAIPETYSRGLKDARQVRLCSPSIDRSSSETNPTQTSINQ